MPRVQEYRKTADGLLADSMMTIAESRTVETLGEACRRAIAGLTGSQTVGLYLLSKETPRLLYSHDVPDGFLSDYSVGMAKADPIIDSILSDGDVVDGASFFGPRSWPKSESYDLLHSWGFSYNMCGPLRCDDTVVGVFYTANRDEEAPYSQRTKQNMAMLCRAASLALSTSMGNSAATPMTYAASRLPAVRPANRLAVDLPPRSAQVAYLVCQGQTNKTIARQMGISDQTVKEHVANLCRRFGTRNRTELAAALLAKFSLQHEKRVRA
jgi:DNA-binding CsgD family transcriptional regulator/transcriptional regulator with GAF, ATPase, and Fis domain